MSLVSTKDGGDARGVHGGGVPGCAVAVVVLWDVFEKSSRGGHRRRRRVGVLAVPAMPRILRRRVRDVLQLRTVPEKGWSGADAPSHPARAREWIR